MQPAISVISSKIRPYIKQYYTAASVYCISYLNMYLTTVLGYCRRAPGIRLLRLSHITNTLQVTACVPIKAALHLTH